MNSSPFPVRNHPDVVDTELNDQETVLLHLTTKLYFSLNATGTRIWGGLKKGLSLDEISRLLEDEFNVEPEQAKEAIAALVAELRQQNLLQEIDNRQD
jgi:hypothetical protein